MIIERYMFKTGDLYYLLYNSLLLEHLWRHMQLFKYDFLFRNSTLFTTQYLMWGGGHSFPGGSMHVYPLLGLFFCMGRLIQLFAGDLHFSKQVYF